LAVHRHLQITANFQDRFTEDLIDAVTNAKQMPMKQVGIEWAIQQSRELKAAGVPVHYYSMGNRKISVKLRVNF
jgi:methylenetetrahydrofolate reductase (NADPH)